MGGESDQVRWRGVRPVEGIRGVWPARNAVRVVASEYVSGIDKVIVYTPDVGKRLFITSAFMSVRMGVVASAWGGLGVRDGDDSDLYYLAVVYQTVVGTYNTPLNCFPAIEIEAGWDVYVQSSHADLDFHGVINGWLEDA